MRWHIQRYVGHFIFIFSFLRCIQQVGADTAINSKLLILNAKDRGLATVAVIASQIEVLGIEPGRFVRSTSHEALTELATSGRLSPINYRKDRALLIALLEPASTRSLVLI